MSIDPHTIRKTIQALTPEQRQRLKAIVQAVYTQRGGFDCSWDDVPWMELIEQIKKPLKKRFEVPYRRDLNHPLHDPEIRSSLEGLSEEDALAKVELLDLFHECDDAALDRLDEFLSRTSEKSVKVETLRAIAETDLSAPVGPTILRS